MGDDDSTVSAGDWWEQPEYQLPTGSNWWEGDALDGVDSFATGGNWWDGLGLTEEEIAAFDDPTNYSNEGRNYEAGGLDPATDSPVNAEGPGWMSQLWGMVGNLFGGSGGVTGSGRSGSTSFGMPDLLGMVGSGIDAAWADRQARQNREWQDGRDSRQNTWATERDERMNGYTTQRDTRQNEFTTQRDERQNEFTTQRDARDQEFRVRLRDDDWQREERLASESRARRAPVTGPGLLSMAMQTIKPEEL